MQINYLQIINTFVQNTKTFGVANESINENLKNTSKAETSTKTGTFVNQNASLQNQDVKFNSITGMQQAALIKELLKLPDDIKDLLDFLMYNNISSESTETLLKQQNQQINTNIIKQLLETNSKESMSKLIKLFQQAPGGTQNTEQLKEILTLLSTLTPKQDTAAQQVITNLTLLYLPWMPLPEKQDLEIKFEKLKNQESEEAEKTALVIYITSINLGRFKITIILNKDNSIKMEIENFEEKNLENKNKKEYLEKILSEINKQTRKDKIKAQIELYLSDLKTQSNESSKEKPDSSGDETGSQKKREVIISSGQNVSPVVIITAKNTAKIILETDEKVSLLDKREEILSS